MRLRVFALNLVGSGFIWSFLIYSLLMFPGEPTLPTHTLVFTGDVMLGRGVAQALGGEWEVAFAQVQPWLAEADLALANLESPLTTEPQVCEGHDLRALPGAVAALRSAGFDAVSLANNHALDAGEAGLQETVHTLRAAGIVPLVEWDALPLPGRERVGVRVGYLALNDSVSPLDVEAAVRAVAAAAQRAPLVVVSIHWGAEYQAGPTSRQRAIAQRLAGAGAGLIVGHGPHVLQGVEWMGETLVAYSLGNLLFDQPYPADCRQGAILRVALRGDRIVAVEALPTVVEQGRVRPAGPRDAAAILKRLAIEAAQGPGISDQGSGAGTSVQHPVSSIQLPTPNLQSLISNLPTQEHTP